MTIRAKRLEVLLSGKQANKKILQPWNFLIFLKKIAKKNPCSGDFLAVRFGNSFKKDCLSKSGFPKFFMILLLIKKRR
jgi:hypothetical protein